MATILRPEPKKELAEAIVTGRSYAQWDRLLDIFDDIRSETPVAWIATDDSYEPFWLITRHEDVMRISKDNKTFLNNPKSTTLMDRNTIDLAKKITGGKPHLVESLVQLDAPTHPQLRRLTQDWFMPKNLKIMEAEIGALAKETADRFLAAANENSGDADFVPLVSAPYPLHVVMQILGVPEDDEQRMLMLTQKLFGAGDEDLSQTSLASMTVEQMAQFAVATVKSFEEYFNGLAKQRRDNPTDDVASIIANATIDGEPLSDFNTAGYYIIIATAGHDTTSASLAGAMWALARDPELFQRVKADRDLLPGLIEEAIRWTSPVQHFMRTAAEDVEVGGVQIQKDDWMMISYIAANHDPEYFDNPRAFDAERSPNRHMAFGAGAHQCLGLHLARLEMRILLNALLDRIDALELAGEPTRSETLFVGSIKTLPLKFIPAN